MTNVERVKLATKSRKSVSELSVIKTEEKAMIYGYASIF